jgi:hypothetical protein
VAWLGRTLRAPALLAAGSLVVHEGRYLVGYGEHSHEVQAEHGHAYLTDAVVPTTAALLALCLVALVLALVRAHRGASPPISGRPAFGVAWLRATLILQSVYAAQELGEGWLTRGHPPGVAGVLGNGGWTAFAIAIAVGALVALLLRGVDAAFELIGPHARLWAPQVRALALTRLPATPIVAPLAPLARGAAGRAPPAFA